MITAVVPMKGESVRVSNKNLRDFNGFPLCYYILNELEAVSEIDEIIVNTDSNEIKKVVTSFNFKKTRLIERPKFLLGHDVEMNQLLRHDIALAKNECILQCHATSPLIKRYTIESAISTFQTSGRDSLFSVNKFQSRFYNIKSEPINHDLNVLLKTQDLDPIFEENSGLYIFTKSSFSKNNRRIGSDPLMFELPYFESIDIDTERDFEIALKLIRIL